MRYSKLATIALITLLVCMLPGCGLMTPEQQATALESIDRMLLMGTITKAQYEALREAILAGGTAAWWTNVANLVGGALLAWAGVRLDRGAPERVRRKRSKQAQAPVAAD